MHSRLVLMLGLLLAFTLPATAQNPLTAPTIMEAVGRLKPGEFLWAPEIAPQGPVLIIVSLATQRAIVYRNGIPIAVSTVSTGKDGYETPTGVFTILQKDIDHRSNLYDDAPMPFMKRLTWGGVALHAGNLPGYPASHGCIRLPHGFAERLYRITRLGLTVIVTDDAALPRIAPSVDLFRSAPSSPAPAAEGIRWHPETSPSGPLSIVISAADKRMIVLRNGMEIGSAPVVLPGAVRETSAFTLRSIDSAGTHWVRIPLPGQTGAGGEITDEQRQGFGVDEGFRRSLTAALVPGAVAVVTNDSFSTAATGEPVTMFEQDDRPPS